MNSTNVTRGKKMLDREYVPFAVEIQVADFYKSLAFYRDVLGFSIVRFNEKENDNFATLSFQGEVFMIAEVHGLPSPRGVGVLLRFILPGGLKEYHDKVKARGAKIEGPIETASYGLTRFFVKDPDGYLLKFATR